MWHEMPTGMEPAATVFMPPSEGECGKDDLAEVVDLDREVVEVEDDTPLWIDAVRGWGSTEAAMTLSQARRRAIGIRRNNLEEGNKAVVGKMVEEDR